MEGAWFLSKSLWLFLLVDLVVAIALLTLMRFATGLAYGVNTREELSVKDNAAFGISIAGSMVALGIVLSGTVTGGLAATLNEELIGMLIYGGLGLVLIRCGRWIQDHLILSQMEKLQQIRKGNVSVALVDAAAAIATALVIRAVLIWVAGLDSYTLAAIISGFVMSQLVLLVVTRLGEHFYRRHHPEQTLQQALNRRDTAIALRYAGYLLATSLAVTAASYLLVYQPDTLVYDLFNWLIASLIMVVLVLGLSWLAKRLILRGIDLIQEVDDQHNIGIAASELAISVAVALIIVGLLS